ncbi:MAG: hypothetical protein EAY75_01840 [Bacteroidetes bacterium]|nr:MAG: hypothetical protein EAY75_01840 [Bacteroidota bacterium]
MTIIGVKADNVLPLQCAGLRQAQGGASALRQAQGGASALRQAQGGASALRQAQGGASTLRQAQGGAYAKASMANAAIRKMYCFDICIFKSKDIGPCAVVIIAAARLHGEFPLNKLEILG